MPPQRCSPVDVVNRSMGHRSMWGLDLELCHPHLWPGTRDGGARLWKTYLGCSTRTLIGMNAARHQGAVRASRRGLTCHGVRVGGCLPGLLPRCHGGVTTRGNLCGRLWTHMDVFPLVVVPCGRADTVLDAPNRLPKLNTRVRFRSSAPGNRSSDAHRFTFATRQTPFLTVVRRWHGDMASRKPFAARH